MADNQLPSYTPQDQGYNHPPQAGGYTQPAQAGGYTQPAGYYPSQEHPSFKQDHYGSAGGPSYPQQQYAQQYAYPGSYQSGAPPGTVIVTQPVTSVIVVGGCPACRVGVLEDEFTCLGILCAILCFPLGLICCIVMRQKRCPNCSAVFG